jgi:mannose-1-phosphate guanylyltransferase/mannose-6-phosphate isomerase
MEGAQRQNGFVEPDAAALRDCRSESIDVAVMERHHGLVVMPFHGAWSDVGSWNAVADLGSPDERGNRIEGQGVAMGSVTGNYIHAPYRRVVALGTHDLIIIDTPDAVLVADRSAAEQVKGVVDQLERSGSPEAIHHRKVLRPWGYYDSVERGPRFQVKRLFVKPLAALSLQMHRHRAEHWIVVRGTAEVTLGTRTFLLAENQSVDIPAGTLHRLYNPGVTPIELIEVQSGDYLGEDDIVRFEDAYGRSVTVFAPVAEEAGVLPARLAGEAGALPAPVVRPGP